MKRTDFHPVMPGRARTVFVSGDDPVPPVRPGDFLLSLASPWRHRAIRFGQRLRIHGADRRYTVWTHAALVVTAEGDLVEAVGTGVRRSHLRAYRDDPGAYQLVHIDATDTDREQVANFGLRALRDKARYNRAVIVCMALTLLTGSTIVFFVDGQFHCSGLVARALERADVTFTLDPVHIMPADLAKYFEVPPPPA